MQISLVAFRPETFYTRHLLHNKLFLHHTLFTPKQLLRDAFCAKHLLCQPPFTPDTFYTRHLLHQTPFTPDKLSPATLHQTPFTPKNFYTRNRLTPDIFFIAHTFYNKLLLHMAPFTPDTFCTRHPLHQKHVTPNSFYT